MNSREVGLCFLCCRKRYQENKFYIGYGITHEYYLHEATRDSWGRKIICVEWHNTIIYAMWVLVNVFSQREEFVWLFGTWRTFTRSKTTVVCQRTICVGWHMTWIYKILNMFSRQNTARGFFIETWKTFTWNKTWELLLLFDRCEMCYTVEREFGRGS